MKTDPNDFFARLSRRGFSLIELLVVLAALALLAGLLVPSLSRARRQTRRVVCGSNLRQLALANHGYAVENDGYYVLAAEDIFGGNLHRWHGARTGVNEPFDPLQSPLRAYLADGRVKRCPAFRTRDYFAGAGQQSGNFEAGCGGYGYNDEYVGGRTDQYGMMTGCADSARDCELRQPGTTVMFTDAAFRQQLSDGTDTYIEYSFAHPPYWHWYLEMMSGMPEGTPLSGLSGRPDPTIHFRHDGVTNVSWCDGHVSQETMDLSAPYVTHAIMNEAQTAAMALGWFGPDNNSLFDLE